MRFVFKSRHHHEATQMSSFVPHIQIVAHGGPIKVPLVSIVCGWQVKPCDPLVTHGLYPSDLKMIHDI